ncbi:MFS transporter [Actinomadura sp. 3N508]|uniref:MFS transporter n=1 Tax=Actinomadura sp. 3N508 TaxID=3375153 RepID=UPI0037877A02
MSSSTPFPATGAKNRPKVLISSFIGTTIEWYDFAIYGTASALVFPKLFFPDFSPVASALLSFSTFGVAFLARPIGGIVFGHYGDLLGRRRVLITTLTLMGLSTFLIGLLPSYATAGVLAPLLLFALRFLQGFSLGGEYSGAILMAVEHAPQDRRGLYGALIQAGSPMGAILANGLFLILGAQADDSFNSWGWRVPFLLSAILIFVAMYVRLTLDESPEFQKVKQRGEVRKRPLGSLLRDHWLKMLLVAGSYISAGVTFYIVTVFALKYGEDDLGMSYNTMVTTLLIGHVMTLFAIPYFGSLSDRIGRRGLFIGGTIGMGIMAYPWLRLMESGSFGLMVAGFLMIMLPYAACYGAMATYYAELFPAHLRFSGYSLGYTAGTIAGSAVAPLVSQSLLETGGSGAIAGYMGAMAVLSAVATVFLARFGAHTQTADVPSAAAPAAAPNNVNWR